MIWQWNGCCRLKTHFNRIVVISFLGRKDFVVLPVGHSTGTVNLLNFGYKHPRAFWFSAVRFLRKSYKRTTGKTGISKTGKQFCTKPVERRVTSSIIRRRVIRVINDINVLLPTSNFPLLARSSAIIFIAAVRVSRRSTPYSPVAVVLSRG